MEGGILEGGWFRLGLDAGIQALQAAMGSASWRGCVPGLGRDASSRSQTERSEAVVGKKCYCSPSQKQG